jgi:phosphatidylserine decarboxylase
MKLPPIHREGWKLIAAFAAVTAILFVFAGAFGWLGVVLTAWCVYFFRDPPRVTPSREGLIVAPADGVVLAVVEAVPPAELDMGEAPRTRLSVFMNVFDVHVNRAPCDGMVIATAYRPGRFVNASFDKASEHNSEWRRGSGPRRRPRTATTTLPWSKSPGWLRGESRAA